MVIPPYPPKHLQILFEYFKEDVAVEIIPVKSYPTTFRRKLIDFAVKVIKTNNLAIIKFDFYCLKKLVHPLKGGGRRPEDRGRMTHYERPMTHKGGLLLATGDRRLETEINY